jgi:hypothetical protein
MIFMFILLCEFFVISKYNEMNCNLVSEILYIVYEVQVLVIWNNHEFGVLMNYRIRCV